MIYIYIHAIIRRCEPILKTWPDTRWHVERFHVRPRASSPPGRKGAVPAEAPVAPAAGVPCGVGNGGHDPNLKRSVILELPCPSSEQSGLFDGVSNGGFGASGFAV